MKKKTRECPYCGTINRLEAFRCEEENCLEILPVIDKMAQSEEKVEIEITIPDGRKVKKKVSKEWFEKIKAEGKAKKIIQVHLINPWVGYQIQHWVVGKDIDEKKAAEFRDPETGDLYVMVHYEEGEPITNVVVKELWNEAKRKMDLRVL